MGPRCVSLRFCGSALRVRCVARGLREPDAKRRQDVGTWDGALMVLLIVCCPEVQVLAVRELGGAKDGEYHGKPT
eukprot:15452937-Alexandrium_andersonii.AAC.1